VVAAGAYFTLSGYRAILSRALELGYRIVPFRGFEGLEDAPVLLLRHDLDHALAPALVVAEAEAALGIRATYFVQTACELYNLLSRESRRLIRRLVDLGHEIGLHYEADRYAGDGGEARLRSDLRLLEDLAGEKVVSAAQHLPTVDAPVALGGFVQNEAYEARFIDPPMRYVSDSLMVWREATPLDLIERRASFQLLTHPDTWTAEYTDVREALLDMRQREIAAAGSRWDALIESYARLLSERATRDAIFRQRRATTPRARFEIR
jgi:hypothetical protein